MTTSNGSLCGPASIGGFRIDGGTYAAPTSRKARSNSGSLRFSNQRSMSWVTTGAPCMAAADKPTIMNRTWCRNKDSNSRSSPSESGKTSATAQTPVQSFQRGRLQRNQGQSHNLGVRLRMPGEDRLNVRRQTPPPASRPCAGFCVGLTACVALHLSFCGIHEMNPVGLRLRLRAGDRNPKSQVPPTGFTAAAPAIPVPARRTGCWAARPPKRAEDTSPPPNQW